MPRDYKVSLQDVLQAISDVEEFSAPMTLEQFRNDKKTVHAVVRNLEVIGEAIKRVPPQSAIDTQAFPGSASPACETSYTSIASQRWSKNRCLPAGG